MDAVIAKINRDINGGAGINATTIYKFAKKRNVSLNAVKNYLNSYFPFIVNKSWNLKNHNLARNYQVVRIKSLGFVQCDIGYYSEEAGKTPTRVKGFVILVDILSRMTFVENIMGSRKTKNVIQCFSRILRRYKKKMGKLPLNIALDQESAFTSKKFIKYITHVKRIRLVFFETWKLKGIIEFN